MHALISRFKEPSSYAALTLVGINVDPGLMQQISTALAAIAGIVGFFLKEKGEQ